MRIPAIYLETTIFNFPFVDDTPNYRVDALQLFAEIRAGKFHAFTSEYTDAYHIAMATVANLDCIVSLNFKHIVKRRTMIETEVINAREGYKRIFIHTPAEVIYEEKY